MPQPIPKALSGLLRGGATVPEKFAFPKSKDSKALKFIPVSTNNVHDDIGAPGYDSDVFFASGVTAPAILGENPLRSIHKELSLNMVEQERLRRAKKLEEKKGKESKLLQTRLQKEIDATVEHTQKEAFQWIQDLGTETMKTLLSGLISTQEETEQKDSEFKSSAKDGLAAAAGRNACEAAERAKEEMYEARQKMKEAKEAAERARNLDGRSKEKQKSELVHTSAQKDVSILKVSLSQGRNFPVFGESSFSAKTCNAYARVKLSQNMKAIREEDEFPIAQFFSKTQSQTSAPSWSEEFEICLPTDIEDEERAEILEIKFYHQPGGLLKASKQDQDSDQVIGSCVIPLRKFVKFVTKVRYPDGSEDPPYFNGECSKWFKLCDDNGHPVNGSFVEDPAEAQIQLTYNDPMKKKTVIDSRAMLLPRYPYQDPVCKPSKTWRDHPEWKNTHGPGKCTCCEPDEFQPSPMRGRSRASSSAGGKSVTGASSASVASSGSGRRHL